MKYIKLEQIITDEINQRKLSAAYSGAWNDGGANNLRDKLNNFKLTLITKYDLRPSEYHKIDDIEVGEPEEFITIIEAYKIKLAKNIKL